MKISNPKWTLQEMFSEVLTRHQTGGNIKEIPFDNKFNHSHFKALATLINAITANESFNSNRSK